MYIISDKFLEKLNLVLDGGTIMAFCSSCGEKSSDGAKFCYGCGMPVNNDSQNSGNRRQEYGGKIVKCPNCGEVLNSFETVCSICGYELRGSKATDAVKEFEYKFEQASSIYKKIDLIKIFAVPNTKEDIREFLILAASNINLDSYNSSGERTIDIRLSDAWVAKFEQVYQKAKILFKGSSEFGEVHDLYLRKQKSIKYAKMAGKNSKFFRKNKEWILIVGGFVGLMLFIGSWSIPHTIKVYQLEEIVNQVENCITVGNYDTARIKANQIVDDTGWSSESKEKWDSIRGSLLVMIDEKQAIAEGKIYIGVSSDDLIGQDYKTVIEQFKKQGFTNIQEVVAKDLITGWLTSDGEVEEVSIDGKTDFQEKSNYVADVEIIITYHTFKK